VGLWRLHVQIEDRPGRLAELAAAVSGAGGNIVSLTVLGERGPDGSVTDELLVEAADEQAATALAERVRAAVMGCTLAARAGSDELGDPVTTSLALARRVAADPKSAPRAVAALLHARVLAGADRGPDAGHTRELRVLGQEVRLWRAWAFTATELARAAVLAELAELCIELYSGPGSDLATGQPAGLGLVLLGNGSEVELRMANPADGPLIAAMHARCTPATRRGRFLDPGPSLPAKELTRLLHGRSGRGAALLALTTDGGHAVGLATVEPSGADDPDAAELAVLVEDAWQARGVATALVRRAVELAADGGHLELTILAHPGNLRITRLLRRAGLRPTAEFVDGLLQVRVPLPQPKPVPAGVAR
jgi:GNAT superfamily N-acetyltransferase